MADHISFERELEKLKSVIKNIAYRFPEPHRDDLEQEGVLGLYFAVESYDPTRGVPFDAFAVMCIKRKMFTYCTHFIKNAPNYVYEIENIGCEVEFEEDILDRAEVSDIFVRLKENLSDMEKNVLELYLLDLSYAEMSERLSISEKSIDNAIGRVKAKLKKMFEAQN